jgi:type II secretory pathway pseudopilin PulG
MMKSRLQKSGGFTLVEMLVYIAIFLLVAVGSVSYLFSLDDLIAQYRVETDLYRSGTNVLEQVTLSLRQADSFNLASVEDNENGILSVTGGATTTVFTRSGDDLNLTINGINYGNMVEDSVNVTNFTVYRYDTTVGHFVRVKLSLTATVGGITKNITLYDGAVIRGAL